MREYMNDIADLYNSDDLVLKHTRLVVFLARKYYYSKYNVGSVVGMDDLIQVGNIGLIHAKRKYNANLSKFSAYAAIWIKSYMQKELIENGASIRFPYRKRNERIFTKTKKLGDYIAPKNEYELDIEKLELALNKLSYKEKNIMVLLLAGKSRREVSSIMKKSHYYVDKMLPPVIKKLQKLMEINIETRTS